jgi:hypothetical protein
MVGKRHRLSAGADVTEKRVCVYVSASLPAQFVLGLLDLTFDHPPKNPRTSSSTILGTIARKEPSIEPIDRWSSCNCSRPLVLDFFSEPKGQMKYSPTQGWNGMMIRVVE